MAGERTAGEVLQARLVAQVAELHRRDAEVRDGVDDGVHQLRVTCRRLRGALATFRPVVDREVTDPVRAELRWLARTLGGGRDAEVVHTRLRALVDDLPRAEVVGPVRRRLDRTHAARLRAAEDHAAQVLASARHRRLLTRLDRLADAPPFTALALEPAAVVLLPRVDRDLRRLARRVDAARAAGDDPAWHDARKAAKRVRYAAETVGAVALTEAARAVTGTLGDRQDTVAARVELRRLAREATAAGESAFTYGVMHESERATAASLLADLEGDWRRLLEVSRP